MADRKSFPNDFPKLSEAKNICGKPELEVFGP
jgi:hypothetical protein